MTTCSSTVDRYGVPAIPDEADMRLDALGREWDIEQAGQAVGAGVSLMGLLLGSRVHRVFYLLPVLAAGFGLRQAATGDCAPLDWLRRLGFRPRGEIDGERIYIEQLRHELVVEQSSVDSFPCSDPPSWSPTTSGPPAR
jgi:hypothetical protein